MKKIWIITVVAAIAVSVISCNKPRRSPGRVYMPDMAYSRAYETYASTEALREKYKGINYTAMPVAGTFAKGDMLWVYPYKNDSAGYVQSAGVKSPINADSIDVVEAERLYLVNCGICHGAKLDGNGPLYKGGDGPFPNKPAALKGDAKYEAMTEGTMFHSLTYGKGSMGSYASQLNVKQRWEVIAWIKQQQGGNATKAAVSTVADTAKAAVPAKTGM
jgi:mono/diheme cytochrome c family protein